MSKQVLQRELDANTNKVSNLPAPGTNEAVRNATDVVDVVVTRIQESSGPTTLTLGTVNDGEFLKRSGSTIISGTAGGTGSSGPALRLQAFYFT